MPETKQERVVILCGGRGYRMGEETDARPKPMILVGNRPIVWHIMKTYAHFGYRRFVLCLGYRGDMFRDYFLHFHQYTQDFIVRTGGQTTVEFVDPCEEEWEIVMAETGVTTTTGGRLRAIEKYIDTPEFHMTYGDGVADVDVTALAQFHREQGRLATVTAVHPKSRFGELDIQGDQVSGFAEKPETHQHFRINGGFFVLNQGVFDYIHEDVFLERGPLGDLCRDGQLSAFAHDGFWQCMDTPAERDYLNQLWETDPPWAVWRKGEATA